MATNRNVTGLDFQEIKQSLKTFLKNQNEFSDFDFEGSGMQVLLDTLAYNTQYTNFYANMIANEMFIDSALLRSSVTSFAKLLGYTPRSATSARAKINIRVNNVSGNPANIVLNKDTKFTGLKDGVTYIFYTDRDYIATAATNYTFENIELFEGKRFNFSYTVNNSLEQNFVIPNDNVDVSTMEVFVRDNPASVLEERYEPAMSMTDYEPTQPLFFIEENSDGKFEVMFGQNVYGKQPSNGNVIRIAYTICAGDAPNGIRTFTLSGNIESYSNFTITTVESSNSGAERESTENVRKLAPKSIQVQNRAITAEDYRTIILRDYPNVDDVKVWGGEEASPLQYGKVFITLLPKENFTITNSVKTFVRENVIKPFNITTILPEIVDVVYIDIIPEIKITYETKSTTENINQLLLKAKQSVMNFQDDFLNRFDKTFLFSRFVNVIDNTDPSFVSNETSFKCKITQSTIKNKNFTYRFNFNNPIARGTLTSSGIVLSDGITHFVEDGPNPCSISGNQVLRLYKIVNDERVITDNDVGRVNYETGQVSLININIFDSNEVSIMVTPKNQNLKSVRENILRIKESDINITMNPI